MTTLLPLVIVIVYIILGLTPVRELGQLTAEQMLILVGPYFALIDSEQVFNQDSLSQLYYVNEIDNILMFTGIAMGVVVALIYIAFFVRWTTLSASFSEYLK